MTGRHSWLYYYFGFRDEVNVFEAGANGAAVAGKTVVAVVVNYIAFLALLSWVDAVLWYFGSRVGYDDLSFEVKSEKNK